MADLTFLGGAATVTGSQPELDGVFGPGFAGLSDRKRLEQTAKELEAVVVAQVSTLPPGTCFPGTHHQTACACPTAR